MALFVFFFLLLLLLDVPYTLIAHYYYSEFLPLLSERTTVVTCKLPLLQKGLFWEEGVRDSPNSQPMNFQQFFPNPKNYRHRILI